VRYANEIDILAALLALGCNRIAGTDGAASVPDDGNLGPLQHARRRAHRRHRDRHGARDHGPRRHPYTIDLLPWKRAYTAALERPDACVFSTTRTPEREASFKWVGPIGEADWVLMARADRAFSLRSLDDARGYRIGTYNGDARDDYLRTRGFDVDPAQNDLINPRKLMMNRIDLWAASMQRGSLALDRWATPARSCRC
jgi:ABC-type amino acid transport substrate-binding protein